MVAFYWPITNDYFDYESHYANELFKNGIQVLPVFDRKFQIEFVSVEWNKNDIFIYQYSKHRSVLFTYVSIYSYW